MTDKLVGKLRRGKTGFAIGMLALLACTQAPAQQLSPFGNQRGANRLSKDDSSMLFDAATKLNGQPDLKAGDGQDWSNPVTGNSGKVTATRLFESHGMACHALTYDISFKGHATPRTYHFNWCKTSAGDWKIRN